MFLLILVTIAANGTIQLATPGSEGLQGLQAVTTGGAQQSTTVLQYAQTPDGQQILVPSNQVVVQGEQSMKSSQGKTIFLAINIYYTFCVGVKCKKVSDI